MTDIRKEFPDHDTSTRMGQRFENPDIEREANRIRAEIDALVEERMTGFDKRNRDASPEDRDIAKAGQRAFIEKMLSAPRASEVDTQINESYGLAEPEAVQHHEELVDVVDKSGEWATEQEVEVVAHEPTEQGGLEGRIIERNGQHYRMVRDERGELKMERVPKAQNFYTQEQIDSIRQRESQEPSPPEEFDAAVASLKQNEQTIDANPNDEKFVLNEGRMNQLINMLASRNSTRDQLLDLNIIIDRDGLNIKPRELLNRVRDYKKEQIKANEKGLLLHYHQTPLNNLDVILNEGALITQDERRKRGEKIKSTGARPDVVLMTRDRYDSEGHLVEAGLKQNSDNLGVTGEVALVFDDSVMDEQDYDSIDEYPNLPKVPLEKLAAVVVSDEQNIRQVQEALAKKGIHARTISRADWLRGYK